MSAKYVIDTQVACSDYAGLSKEEEFIVPQIFTTVVHGLSYQWQVHIYPKGVKARWNTDKLCIGIERKDILADFPQIQAIRHTYASYKGDANVKQKKILEKRSFDEEGWYTVFPELTSTPQPTDVLIGRFTLHIDIDDLSPLSLPQPVTQHLHHSPLRMLFTEVILSFRVEDK